MKPDKWKIWKYYLISRIFGFTFGIKLMERGEEDAQENYEQLRGTIAEADAIIQDENDHEEALIALLNEDHSLAPELDRLVAAGRMTEDEARHDPRRHMLRSAVTGDEIDMVDVSRRPLKLEPGDYVILASDGLHTLETSEIARLVTAYSAEGAEAVAKALIREVEQMREPHQDNATVIAVRLKPTS